MPSKKKKYNARFPAGRIKKIMQTDEEVGKVAQAVPVIISRTLELFVESLLRRAMQITSAKNAKTLTPSHMKQCILSESRFDFLKDLVEGIPDVSCTDDEPGTPLGNLSPGIGMSYSSKSQSVYNPYQFRQTSDSSSSKSSGATSQVTQVTPVPQTSQPKFYKEIPIGSEEVKNNEGTTPPAVYRTPVIQHTASQSLNNCALVPPNNQDKAHPGPRKIPQFNDVKVPNCIKISENTNSSSEEEEEEENDVEPEENGFHKSPVIAKTCVIDEDYDT